MLIAFNKPYRVLTQFSDSGDKSTLADFIDVPGVYPAGRLDFDSEGLLLLTDDGALQHAISAPSKALFKRYLVQVEGIAGPAALRRLQGGIELDGSKTAPGQARVVEPPAGLWSREPPIRQRLAIPTSWLELSISEGRNRQVRRMTAAVGLPTLRLIRIGIGELDLFSLGLACGQWQSVEVALVGIEMLQKRTAHQNQRATHSHRRAR